MSLKPVYPKKRYVITFSKENNNCFAISGPHIDGKHEAVKVFLGPSANILARQAFDDGADEVKHDYDLGIVDMLGYFR